MALPKNLIHRRAKAENLDPVQFGEVARLQLAGFEQQLAIDEAVTTSSEATFLDHIGTYREVGAFRGGWKARPWLIDRSGSLLRRHGSTARP